MEIIIGGVFILIVAGLLILRKKPTSTTEAPYKVETVSSDNGIKFVVVPEPVVETPAPVVEATPVVEEAPAKKTRAPRAPKAEKAPKAAKPKAPAKKTTTAKSKKA
jgi:hypothetical protein